MGGEAERVCYMGVSSAVASFVRASNVAGDRRVFLNVSTCGTLSRFCVAGWFGACYVYAYHIRC